MQPGQCWAFKGSQGYLVLQLSTAIKPTAFSLEHIPKALSPTGRIDSAPKRFSVWVRTLVTNGTLAKPPSVLRSTDEGNFVIVKMTQNVVGIYYAKPFICSGSW